MLKIFLSSHGRFASGIRSSCEILMGPSDNLTVFDAYLDDTSVQQHLDAFYETREQMERVRQRGQDLHRAALTARDRVARKIALQEQELAAFTDFFMNQFATK